MAAVNRPARRAPTAADLWLRRARSVGQARQRLNLPTYALAVNALALHRHRRTSSDPPLPLAA